MIDRGDRIAVGVSGGKDSLLLLHALSLYRKFSHKDFSLTAVTVTMGLEPFDLTPVKEMCALGARKENLCAALGPAIGKCCFETDDDVPAAVAVYLGGETEGLFVRRGDGKTLVDLRGANKRRLLQLGLREENIDVSDECSFCSHEKYWSHRYTKGQRGSQAAAIVLR